MRTHVAFSEPAGVVSGLRLEPRLLIVGCGLLALALLAARTLARRVYDGEGTHHLLLEGALIGLVVAILAALSLLAAGLFEYE